jgi:tRNA(fMet)-specific endonuclease VapC
MKRYLLNTGIAGLYLDWRRGVYERARAEVVRGTRVRVGAPVVAELAYRAEGSANRGRNLQRLRQALASWKLWLVTEEVAFEYGRVAIELRHLCRVIGQNDMMIAAIARTLGNCTVVTMDRDLGSVPGLPVENWAEPEPPAS